MDPKIRERIWNFAYIDFQLLLPSPTKETSQPLQFFQSGESIAYEEKSRKITIDRWQVWLQAFLTYAAVLTTKHPSRGPELFQYQCNILHRAQMHPWHKIYE